MRSCWILPGVTLFLCVTVSMPECQEQKPRHSDAAERGKTAPSRNSASGPGAIPRPLTSGFGGSSQTASLFDAVSGQFTPAVSSVEVHGLARPGPIKPLYAGGEEIVATAGALGDVSRFLDELPGVVASSDMSDDLEVRGGDPMENLFLVDGIQVPDINSLATLGTTGGFNSMIDSAAIQSVTFYAGDSDAEYPERLSSVIDIQTLEPKEPALHSEADLGIQGVGGLAEIPVHGSDLLVSAHHGLLNLLEKLGVDTLPSYTNELARFKKSNGGRHRLTVLELGGWDSIKFAPCPNDLAETSTIDSEYSGWRETTGVEWRQTYSKNTFGVVNISDSVQVDQIDQQDQLLNPTQVTRPSGCAPSNAPSLVPVYMEKTNSAFTTAGYRFEWNPSWLTVAAGSAFWLQRPQYRIDQPLGAVSPYSAAPVRTDSTSFTSNFSTGESGTYTELTARPVRGLVLSAGGRLQTFALGDHNTLSPYMSLRFSMGEYVAFHAALATYAQRPPFAYLLSFPQNRFLLPMRSTNQVVGIDIGPALSSQIHIEAYEKSYRDIPASMEYPTVNLHDLLDTLGQQVIWLPMTSGGRGRAAGMEFSTLTRIGSRFLARGSVAYSRAMFAGLDGVMRPGNFDLPWVANFTALQRLGRGFEISSRFEFASGHPYTPFDLPDSLAQNRAVYDTTKMNALRAPYYARLDIQMNKDFLLHGAHMELYLGVNNALDRSNFLGYVWLARAKLAASSPIDPVYELDQIPIFPNFGLRYIFR